VKLRTLAVLVGALAVASAPFVFAVTGGGIPSFLQLLGLGLNTAPQTTVPITVQNLSPNVTAIQAKNDTAHDVEILATTSTAGNSQFRATNFGGTNWAFGNVRSSNAFQMCNSATLATGQCYTFNTTGQVVFPAPSTGSTLNVTGVSGGASPAIFVTGSAGGSGLEINSGMQLTLNSAGTNFGMVQNDAADHWCLASGTSLLSLGTNIFCWDKNQNITAPGSGTVPWTTSSNMGSCNFSITMAGTSTPTVQSNRGCTITPVRNSIGSYNFNASGIASNSTAVCETDSSSSGPFVYTAATNAGNTVLLNIFLSTTGVLTDPPSGAHWRCAVGT
jgi:hypothetical protein